MITLSHHENICLSLLEVIRGLSNSLQFPLLKMCCSESKCCCYFFIIQFVLSLYTQRPLLIYVTSNGSVGIGFPDPCISGVKVKCVIIPWVGIKCHHLSLYLSDQGLVHSRPARIIFTELSLPFAIRISDKYNIQ